MILVMLRQPGHCVVLPVRVDHDRHTGRPAGMAQPEGVAKLMASESTPAAIVF